MSSARSFTREMISASEQKINNLKGTFVRFNSISIKGIWEPLNKTAKLPFSDSSYTYFRQLSGNAYLLYIYFQFGTCQIYICFICFGHNHSLNYTTLI